MAELKTRPTRASVGAFLGTIPDAGRRRDARAVHELMKRITRSQPRMWGPSIVGYGDQHLKYASGRELDWFVVGFSPRKQALTLYLSGGLADARLLLDKLGKHKTGQGCLYIESLDRVHLPTLERLIARSVKGAARPAPRHAVKAATARTPATRAVVPKPARPRAVKTKGRP